MITVPPMGVELYQAAQAAAQRFQDWMTGFLAGQGHTANYSIEAYPGGVVLVRRDAQGAEGAPGQDPSVN
jgi:hypothetical protein